MRGIYVLGDVHTVSLHFDSTLLNDQATEVRAQGVGLNGQLLSCGCATNTRGPDSILLSPRQLINKSWPVEIEIILSIVAGAASCQRFVCARHARL